MEPRFEALPAEQKLEAYRLLTIRRSRHTPETSRGRHAQLSSCIRDARSPKSSAWGRSMLAKRGGYAKSGAKKKEARTVPQPNRTPDAIVISGRVSPWGDNGAEARQEITRAVTERLTQVLSNDSRFQMSRRIGGGSFTFDVIIVQNPPAS